MVHGFLLEAAPEGIVRALHVELDTHMVMDVGALDMRGVAHGL